MELKNKPTLVLLIAFCGILLAMSGCSLMNTAPQSLFVVSETEGVAPLFVEFDALMSHDVDSEIAMYAWDFGDGTTSIKSASEAAPAIASHTYQLAGTYTVTLVVTDEEGASSSRVGTEIQVLAPPVPANTNQSPNASFSASPTSGQAPLAVSFDASGSSDTDGSITSYAWSFGDGASATGSTANHTYSSEGTYTAQLTVVDDDGSQDTYSREVQVVSSASGIINPPTAAVTASPVSGQAPLVVSFDASASSDSDGSIVSYTWEFDEGRVTDDGAIAFGVMATHTFEDPGNYTVILTVMDEDFAIDIESIDIEVLSSTAPTASFTASPASGQAPLVVSFDASGSSDEDGTITSYIWNFGDGEFAEGITVNHTYFDEGTCIAQLTVTDDDGATDLITRTIQVSAATASNTAPTASFSASPTSGEAPLAVSFDASASSDLDGSITSYAWSFGDGESATGSTANHTYSTEGTYIAELTVTDDEGATDTTSQTLEATPLEIQLCQIETAYLATDGLTVTLHSFVVVEKSGSYEYTIDYTLTNNSPDQAITEGTFKMYYANEAGGLNQYGSFGTLFPGDTLNRTYTFEELKTKPFELLEYHHDSVFSQSPLQDSLKWSIQDASSIADIIASLVTNLQVTVSASENEADILENWTYDIVEFLMWGELTLQATNISDEEFSSLHIKAQAYDSNGVMIEECTNYVSDVAAGMTVEFYMLWLEAERIVSIDINEITAHEL